MSQQKFTAKISTKYNEEERIAIGIEILDVILARTKKGKDKDNKDFTGYSKSYVSSFNFKLAGKNKNKVDLTLSGEMLNATTVLGSSDGSIDIGIPENDKFNNAKAEGNISGSYGGKPDASKARDFMGISKKDLKKITDKYPTTKKGTNKELTKLLLASEASTEIASNFFVFEDLT